MRFEELEEVEAQIKELEYLVKQCRIHYEQFFMGVEKREPVDLRRKIQSFLKNSAIDKHRKASIKFRFLTVTQKFVTLSNYWDRVLRTMEDGTFNYMSYRGFRPRVADEEGRPGEAPATERGVARVDVEELEREAIAHLAENWGEQKLVDDREPARVGPELSPDDVEQVFPPGVVPTHRPAPAAPPPPRPVQAPTQQEVRPSQRPTVTIDAPPLTAAPAPLAPKPPAGPALYARPVEPARPVVAPRPAAAPPAATEGITGARHLYDKYRQAKVNAIADSEDLSYEQFEQRLAKKRDLLKEKFQQDFEFDVVSRDGKVSIVAKKR